MTCATCGTMSELESLVQSYFISLEVHEDEYTGYIDGSGEFSRFKDDLRAIGFTFVIRTTNNGSTFLFNHTRKGAKTQVPFFGPLFQITKNSSYECRFGKKRNHAPTQPQNGETESKIKRGLQPSKKIGCKAMMHVCQLTIYPDFTITEYNSRGSTKQTEVRRKLIKAITASKQSPPIQRPPTSVTRYSISISRESLHSHSLTVGQACQPLHPKLIAEIKRLASDQNATVLSVRLHLESFVQRMFEGINSFPPNRQNRCYYPTNKVIYQHLYSFVTAKNQIRSDRITLENYVGSRNFTSADLDDRNEDSALCLDDGTISEPNETSQDITDKYCLSDNSEEDACTKTIPTQLVKVKIMSPNLSSMSSPNKNIVPKLKVLSEEADVSSLRSEICKLLELLRDRVHATEDVEVLKETRSHLIAASLALASAPANKTVSVFLRSASNEAQKVTPLVIRNRVAFKMEPVEYGSILGE